MDLNIIQQTQDIVQSAKAAAPVAPRNSLDPEAARKAATAFEEMFVSQLLQNMPSGTDPKGPFGGGQAEEFYQSMMNEQYAKSIVKNGGLGLSDTVYREMLKMQEVQNGPK
jgi:flagellar protein FlgJ